MANKKKNTFNMYEFMNRKKKTVVLGMCMLLILTMVAGIFAQLIMY